MFSLWVKHMPLLSLPGKYLSLVPGNLFVLPWVDRMRPLVYMFSVLTNPH